MWHQLKDFKPEEGKYVIVCTNNAKVFIGTINTGGRKDVWEIGKLFLGGVCDYDSDALVDRIPASTFDYWTEVPLWNYN